MAKCMVGHYYFVRDNKLHVKKVNEMSKAIPKFKVTIGECGPILTGAGGCDEAFKFYLCMTSENSYLHSTSRK